MTPVALCAEEAPCVPRRRVGADRALSYIAPPALSLPWLGPEVGAAPARPKSRFRETAVMQVAIVLASVGLIFVQLRIHAIGRASGLPRLEAKAGAGEVVSRGHMGRKTVHMAPVDDPERVKGLFPTGSTYEILIKGGFVAPLEDAGDGVRHLAFAFETLTRRTIESNDGRRIVERRRFESRKVVKLVTDAEDLSLDLGPPQTPILESLGDVQPIEGSVELPAESVAEAILATRSQPALERATSTAAVRADSLSGKEVRITYVDGLGVESVVPIGCSLTRCELKMLFHTAVLADCYFFPRSASPQQQWRVDADQLIGFFDPTLPAIPRGKLSLRSNSRGSEPQGRGGREVSFVEDGEVNLISTDTSYGRVGFLSIDGVFRRSPDGRLQTASLKGPLRIAAVSQDAFLFDEILRDAAALTVSYSCKPDQGGKTEVR